MYVYVCMYIYIYLSIYIYIFIYLCICVCVCVCVCVYTTLCEDDHNRCVPEAPPVRNQTQDIHRSKEIRI